VISPALSYDSWSEGGAQASRKEMTVAIFIPESYHKAPKMNHPKSRRGKFKNFSTFYIASAL